ncbi:hypothetical protein B0H13DRAFT_2233402 [Mycena leptocephala]|nr:hypothetical protein B0H13DRAFT_2233402 [Mycena leptocephala]
MPRRLNWNVVGALKCNKGWCILERHIWHAVLTSKYVYPSNSVPQLKNNVHSLENMRYRSCTAEDIKFLRTRIASDKPGHPNLDSVLFRNVSVITAWNVHKDAINQLGAKRFAQDTRQELHEFYSIDRLSLKGVDAHRIKLQDQLWNATPSATSEHVPGCLRLCIRMPVMIKSNDATELCITKGQEAIVKGWDDSIGPHGKKVLETLFVELVNPPRPIQIEGLPLNVVPLPRTTTKITALLEDDTLLMLVLQNFSMTDYGAQGKSRNPNVCHLNNCKTHMGYYVCLSRGTKAEGAAIIQGFDEKIITGGLTGFMRQEFRELEMLDEITRLNQAGELPPQVTGIYRGQLLRSYKVWCKDQRDPAHFHPVIRQDAGIIEDFQKPEKMQFLLKNLGFQQVTCGTWSTA